MTVWALTELVRAVLFERSNAARRSQPVKLSAILENLAKLLASRAAVAFLVAAAWAVMVELPASVEAAEQRAPEDSFPKWEAGYSRERTRGASRRSAVPSGQ